MNTAPCWKARVRSKPKRQADRSRAPSGAAWGWQRFSRLSGFLPGIEMPSSKAGNRPAMVRAPRRGDPMLGVVAMRLATWWRRRPLPPKSQAPPADPATAELARLERLAEQAYSAMYDVPPLCSTKDGYDD